MVADADCPGPRVTTGGAVAPLWIPPMASSVGCAVATGVPWASRATTAGKPTMVHDALLGFRKPITSSI
jgi:hypothetical protein